MLNKPLVITGTPRAGKTCIAEILAQLPEFSYVSEPVSIWNQGQAFGQSDQRIATDASEEIKQAITKGCQEAIRYKPQGRYLDDLAYHAIRISFLTAVLPNVRIIHVLRDPFECIPEMIYGWTYQDSIVKAIGRRRKNIRLTTLPPLAWRFLKNYINSRTNSHRATWGPMPLGMAEVVNSQPPHLVAAHHWQKINQIAYDALNDVPAEQWMRVKLEDMIADTEGIAQKIAEFAEIEDVQTLKQLANRIIEPGLVFEKKIATTPDQQKEIQAVVGELRAKLGY